MSKTRLQLAMLSIAAITLLATPAVKADTNTAFGLATATVLTAMTMTQQAGNALNFGTVVSPNTAGFVSVSANGALVTNNVQIVPSSTHGPAIFNLTGNNSSAFYLILPTTAVTMTQQGGSATMTVDTFTTSIANGLGALSATGTGTVNIGGTLHVGAGQTPGIYTGTFAVTFGYN